jgi:hypothetical protein
MLRLIGALATSCATSDQSLLSGEDSDDGEVGSGGKSDDGRKPSPSSLTIDGVTHTFADGWAQIDSYSDTWDETRIVMLNTMARPAGQDALVTEKLVVEILHPSKAPLTAGTYPCAKDGISGFAKVKYLRETPSNAFAFTLKECSIVIEKAALELNSKIDFKLTATLEETLNFLNPPSVQGSASLPLTYIASGR